MDRSYQLALRTPGILPSLARVRKQIRQILNFRYTPCARPQSSHRRTTREANFGFCLAFQTKALLAIYQSCSSVRWKGIPISVNNRRPSASLRAPVTKVTFMPWLNSILSRLISGKTDCSPRPIE